MAAADHGDLFAGKPYLTEQDIFNIINVVAISAGDRRNDLIAAAGDHNAVRLERLNTRDRARRVEVHLDAVFLHLGDLRVHKFLRHVLARRLGSEDGAAAERAARFKDHGLEAALFHQQGSLHTGRSAADNSHLAAIAVFHELVIAKRDLVAGDGVERAVQRAAGNHGLVAVHAAEALADEILTPGHGLLHKIGVGDVHTGHTDKVTHALLQQLLGKLRMLDGVDRDDRNADLALDGLDKAVVGGIECGVLGELQNADGVVGTGGSRAGTRVAAASGERGEREQAGGDQKAPAADGDVLHIITPSIKMAGNTALGQSASGTIVALMSIFTTAWRVF